MPVLTPKKSFESKESVITVDELPVGTHVIRLVVVDDEGNSSDPFDVTVEVTERGRVIPPLDTNTLEATPVVKPARTVKTVPVKPTKPKPKPGDKP